MQPLVFGELHESLKQLTVDGEETEAAAARVAAPYVHNRGKREVRRLRKGQKLLREEVEVEPLTRW
jgi:hypothetical protein